MGDLTPIRVVDSPTIEAPRRRGKSLTRRTHQQGYVYQKGRRKSDPWRPDELAFVQFYRDVPGEPDQRHVALCLGHCRTRSIAERTAAENFRNSASIQRRPSLKLPPTSLSDNRPKSGSSLSRQSEESPLPKTRLTHAAVLWIGGCIRSSETLYLPRFTT